MREIDARDIALLSEARRAASDAYCPYSRFPVGAAVETEVGIFVGCNVENASYPLGVCAERVAVYSAIAAGARRMERLAVTCPAAQESDNMGARMPCGACRQVLSEHMASDSEILIDGAGVWRVDELLPAAFCLPAVSAPDAGPSDA